MTLIRWSRAVIVGNFGACSDVLDGAYDDLVGPDQERQTLPVASDKKGTLPIARRRKR
jgi:hypothetical protein